MLNEIRQNPGDLSIPEGWVAIPKKKVLVISNNKAAFVRRDEFDEVVALIGTDFSDEEQKEVLKETTI